MIDAKSPEGAQVEVILNGRTLGVVDIQPSDKEITPCGTTVTIPACELGKIKLLVKKGTAQLHKLHFVIA